MPRPNYQVYSLRRRLGLSQVEFAQLFGIHFMTVSKWERAIATPTTYQQALLDQFTKAIEQKPIEQASELKLLLTSAGIVPALRWLLAIK